MWWMRNKKKIFFENIWLYYYIKSLETAAFSNYTDPDSHHGIHL